MQTVQRTLGGCARYSAEHTNRHTHPHSTFCTLCRVSPPQTSGLRTPAVAWSDTRRSKAPVAAALGGVFKSEGLQ